MRTIVMRLLPGDDLRRVLDELPRRDKFAAGCIVSAVGSLRPAVLRFAGLRECTLVEGDTELITLAGTLSADGAHLHMSVADSRGKVQGGHVLAGCIVRTTVEIVVAVLDDWTFRRETDASTGFRELVATPHRN